MDTKTKKSIARSLLKAADVLSALPEDPPDVQQAMVAVEKAERDLAQIRSSIEKLIRNPAKYEPQRDNVLTALKALKGSMSFISRKILGEDVIFRR